MLHKWATPSVFVIWSILATPTFSPTACAVTCLSAWLSVVVIFPRSSTCWTILAAQVTSTSTRSSRTG
ncbi:unnamed protein product [Ectocarpus sp. 4 AP-2014]